MNGLLKNGKSQKPDEAERKPDEPEANESKKYYFAYGKNMSREVMGCRCHDPEFIGKATLQEYRFLINTRGVSTIMRKKNYRVEGILWLISKEDVQSLDNFEGCNYHHEDVVVKKENGEVIKAYCYIDPKTDEGKPRDNYLETIIEAACNEGFSQEYLNELRSWKNHSV